MDDDLYRWAYDGDRWRLVMKHKQYIYGGIGIVIVAVIIGIIYYVMSPARVNVTEASERDMPIRINNEANVTALNKADVNSSMSGQVLSYAVKVGDTVKQGQVLATIDTTAEQGQLASLMDQLARAQAPVVQQAPVQTTIVPGAVSQADVDRARQMMESGIITQKEFNTIQARAQATTVTTGGGYTSAPAVDTSPIRAAIAQLQTKIAQATIVAPMDGVVAAIYNEDRKIAIEGKPVMLIQQNTPVVATLSIPQNFALTLAKPDVKTATQVFLKVDKEVIPGEITYIDVTSPQGTPSVLIKATFANDKSLIKPGDFYTLLIESEATAPALTVPEGVIHENQDGKFVYIVTEDNTVDIRVVEVGETKDGYSTILNGLNKGEKIITSKGHYELGQKVSVKS